MGSEKKYALGFDLGGTKMLAVVFDEKWKAVGRRRRKTKAFLGLETGLQRIRDTITDAVADAGIEMDQVAGIGMGIPQ